MSDLSQIDFDFGETSNTFRNNLKNGTFTVLFEVDTPARTRDFNIAVDNARLILEASSKVRGLETGLAITDKTESTDSWNAAEFARSVLKESPKDRHVVYISGRKSSLEDITDMLGRCAEAGIQNIVAVSGDGYSDETKSPRRQPCFDSCNILHFLRNSSQHSQLLFPGCAVNPFKYSPNDSFPQYFKLVKKVNFGANFIVVQAGWDMLKHQELRWYLDSRELHYPTMGRILLLTPEAADDIKAGKRPGIYIPRRFGEILDMENRYGYQQFASAQWRRIQIQVAGFVLMGYSGVQIAGITRPTHLKTLCEKIREALSEFNSFQTWKNAYLNHIANSDMAPPEHRFYLFDNLLKEPHPSAVPVISSSMPSCSFTEKSLFSTCKLMFSKDHLLDPTEHRIFKKIFAACPSCSYCRLPLFHYICPETCPKGLANGPCGGSKPNSNCELRDKPCIHERRARIAAWLNQIDTLEERFIRHPSAAAKVIP